MAMILGTIVVTEAVFSTRWFALLISFVALNTLMYLTLAISKMVPKLYLSNLRKRRYKRSDERSIYPDGMEYPTRAPRRFDPEP